MKLTKGKISKLINKKRQSKKKYKNKKQKTKNRRTFRKKRNINLSNKTLKNHRYKKTSGGDPVAPLETGETIPSSVNEEVPKSDDLLVPTEPVASLEPVETIPSSVNEEVPKNDDLLVPTEPAASLEPVETIPSSVNEEVPKSDEILVPTEPVETIPSRVNEEVIIPTPSVTNPFEANDFQESLNEEQMPLETNEPPIIVNEEVTKSDDDGDVSKEPVMLETNISQPIVNEEVVVPINETSRTGLPEEVSKSIDTVMEFVTSKIADKINLDIGQENPLGKNSKIQNGIDLLNEENKTLLSSQNGGKQKKFRLTRKSRGK